MMPIIDPEDPGAEDRFFPISVANKVPQMFQTCLIIWTCLCVLAIFLVRRNPELADNNKVLGDKDVEEGSKKKVEDPSIIGLHEAFTSRVFFHMCTLLFMGEFFLLYNAANYKVVA